jgi:hypothetical protein
MPASPLLSRSSNKAAALIIVLAFVVLLAGLSLAYLSRTTSERQQAQSSYNDTSSDLLARTALDIVVSNLQQEIVNGSTATTVSGSTVYTPLVPANMIPQRSGNPAGAPNLIRRSVRSDPIPAPGLSSLASAVSSAPQDPANPNRGDVTVARWNAHYLVPKQNTGTDDSIPINAFAAPDWVFVTGQAPTVITAPNGSVVGRFAYAVYDEGGLLDINVAGYPTNTTVTQSGRKGSLAYADLTALGNYPIPNGTGGVYQVDKLVGWRNYATTQPSNNFPDSNFAANFQSDSTRAAAYFTSIITNTNGFLSPSTATWNNRTDQIFVQRQELIDFRKAVGSTTSFSANALQYLSTFSREINAPSFSPSTPAGSTIDYAALASTATAINPNFLLRRVTTVPNGYKRFDGTTPVVGDPLVKTRFPLSRLAWITYKGPSAAVYALNSNDPVITALTAAGVSLSTIQAGTAANVKTCFGLTFGGTVGDPSNAWIYTNPTGASAASAILRLDQVAAAAREPDFFELLQAGILSGSLGQSSGGVSPTGSTVFGTLDTSASNYMSSTIQHLLTIGACIIDQADPDSIPTRIQFIGTNGSTWTAYGVENLPYITQMYPIAGQSFDNPAKWSTYLLFQLWNPQANASILPVPVRLRVDGGLGTFAGGNNQTWNTGSADFINTTGQSVTVTASFSASAPLSNQNTTVTTPATVGTFGLLYAPAIPTPTPTPTPTP